MASITTITAGSPGSAGTTLAIAGSGLAGATKVNFGNKSATATVTGGGTGVTCTVPTLCAGQYNVNVTVGSATTNPLSFFYAAAPSVGAVAPVQGAASPGTLTVSGSGLLNATTVTFGAIGTATPTVVNDSTITVTAPAHGAFTACQDTVDLTVTTPGGTSITSVADQFTYFNAPAVTAPAVSPASGPAGTSVTVNGTCFDSVSAVTFTPAGGGTATSTTDFTPISETQLTVVVPATLTVGTTYDVQVVTPGGASVVVVADDQFAVTA
jgi:IPT/TIG domain-containing protein